MTQTDTLRVNECVDRELIDTEGDRIGKIHDVYIDDQTGKPEWFAVKTGWFGTKVSFVPIQQASFYDGDLQVPFTKQQVKDAPKAEPDGKLSQQEEADLYSHYGIRYGESRSQSGLPESGPQQGQGTRQARAGDDDASSGDRAMTRSEEELTAGKKQKAAGRARLVKYVEKDHVNVTVPVTRERAKLVTEPITDQNVDQSMRGPDIRESVHEETLYEEEPVIEKRTVPKERVRLEKEQTTDEEQVEADVRKERIKTEGDVDEKSRRR